MTKEIGGYFEYEKSHGASYHEGAIALNSGRAALVYLIELRDINSILLPKFLCGVVGQTCQNFHLDIRYYEIDNNFLPKYNFTVNEDEYLFVVDYYGQLSKDDIEQALIVASGRVIVDETQGFFRKPWNGADVLYSCRKFFGVSDGGYLYTKDNTCLKRELEVDESWDRMEFILGRFERSAREFFTKSKDNNKRFTVEGLKNMSLLTKNIMRSIDYEHVRKVRYTNFSYLHNALMSHNLLSNIIIPDGAFMYPFLVNDASGIRERLAKNNIFIPVLWPNVLDSEKTDSIEFRYAKNILPLPVDQRYGLEDMDRIINEIRYVTDMS